MTQKIKDLLDERYEWPCEYQFKFIIKDLGKEGEVKGIFQADLPDRTAIFMEKLSRTGKYKSLSVKAEMRSSSEVMSFYQKVGSIEGIMSL